MNQNIKYVGLLAILPLLMVSLIPNYVGLAEAKQAKNDDRVGHLSGARSYGSANAGVICGDKLCSEDTMMTAITKKVTHEDMPDYMPSIENVQVSNFSGDSKNTYNAIYKVTAASKDIANIMVLVESDVDSMVLPIGGIQAYEDSISIVRINANDPMTITATLLSFQLND